MCPKPKPFLAGYRACPPTLTTLTDLRLTRTVGAVQTKDMGHHHHRERARRARESDPAGE
jgi:hypothetical protein